MAVWFLWLTLYIFLPLLAFFFLYYSQDFRREGNVPPGSFGFPVVGETLQYLGTQKKNKSWLFVQERVQRYGKVFKTSILLSPTVVLASPAGTKFIFSNEGKLVANSWPSPVARLLGEHALALKNGEDHKRLKDLLMAFLKPDALRFYVRRVSRIALQHLQDQWDGKHVVGSFWSMKRFTFSLVCNLFLSLESEEEQQELAGPFNAFQNGLMQLPLNFPGTRYYKAVKAREEIIRLIKTYIEKRRKELADGVVPVDHDLLSVLLTTPDDKGNLPRDAEIIDNILLLLFAGHDTSSSLLTGMMKFLADNPMWKNKVLEEQLQVRAGKPEAAPTGSFLDYALDYDDLKKMKWTWRVAQETLRLLPAVQGTFRQAMKEFEVDGFRIPKGWKLYWSVSSHRNEEFFPEPHKFDPSRFDGPAPAPYTFLPFGGGPRLCPGNEFAKMEVLVFMHYLVQKYDWKLVDKDELFTVDPMPFPKKGLFVEISPRL